jgi:hypothetical protein
MSYTLSFPVFSVCCGNYSALSSLGRHKNVLRFYFQLPVLSDCGKFRCPYAVLFCKVAYTNALVPGPSGIGNGDPGIVPLNLGKIFARNA